MNLSPIKKVHYSLKALLEMGWVAGWKMAVVFFLKCDAWVKPKGYLEPFLVRGGTSDPVVALSIFATREYKTPYQDTIDLILDLGGNVGYSAIYFSHHYPNAQVVVLEPHVGNYQVLSRNIRPYANISPIHAGLGDGQSRLILAVAAESWSHSFEESAQSESGVKSISMKQLIEQYGQGKSIMVKMDVEGAERRVFEKDASWLGEIQVIQIEIHDCWKSVFSALNDYDYTATLSVENMIIDLRSPRKSCL